jgi:hypothetical protein
MALFGMAVALQLTRRIEQAAAVYRKILNLYPNSEEAHTNLNRLESKLPSHARIHAGMVDANVSSGVGQQAVAAR